MTTIKVTEEQVGILDKIQTEKGLEYRLQARDYLFGLYTGEQIVGKEVPEGCQRCSMNGGFFEGKMHCVERLENKLPKMTKRSVSEAQACSNVPTLITMARKEELVQEIRNAENREKYWREQAEKSRIPNEQLFKQKSTLDSRVSELQNGLLERDAKIDTLNATINGLNKQIEEVSHDKVWEENQGLKLRLDQGERRLENYKLEIKKLEALIDKKNYAVSELSSKTKSTLRGLKEQIPVWLEGKALENTIQVMQKKIDACLDYLDIATS